MSLFYPIGFVALVAIPVLILIYIIKNRYTEQTVSSTYLWTLSERFIKRRIPINRITGILSLILQILAVILIAVILCGPYLIVRGGAENYCFILDASGSMNAASEVGAETTRFEKGKDEILKIIDESMQGSRYTLIYAGEATETIFENYSDKQNAMEIVEDLSSAYTATPLTGALSAAQKYFTANPSAKTYLVTDKNYQTTRNITLLNVSGGGENYAVGGVSAVFEDGKLNVSGYVTSYESDALLKLELYFADDGGNYVKDSETEVAAAKLSKTPFEFSADRSGYTSLKVAIARTDSLMLDNEQTLFNAKFEIISKIQLVSDSPFFMRAALSALEIPEDRLDITATGDYVAGSGYGLYIFENFVPDELPREGAVWFINPSEGITGANFSTGDFAYAIDKATFSSSSSTTTRNLLNGVIRNESDDFKPYKYIKCGLSGKFSTLLTCDGSPIVFAGTNVYGNRETVFAFDLKDFTLFTLGANLSVLTSNIISYSFPPVVEKTSYLCGDVIEINRIPNSTSVGIIKPSGEQDFPDNSSGAVEYELTEVGVYTITLAMKDNSEMSVNVYCSLPEDESVLTVTEEEFIIQGTPQASNLDGIIDDLLILFIVLAVIAVADYGVYCYEQYQLR